MIDRDDREIIRTALDETLIVEAAAGTGKTTELVARILSVLARGASTVDRIVAVTFTEKAAGELKLRLREELERAREVLDVEGSRPDAETRTRLDQALEQLEEAHVSTIHGFCADLLRERPVEARIDPLFQVSSEVQAQRLYHEAFRSWIQQRLEDPSEGIRRALRRRVWSPDRSGSADEGPIDRLRRAGWNLIEWRDFPSPWRREPFDRIRTIDRMVASVHAFADLTSSPSAPSDSFYIDTAAARQLSADVLLAEGERSETRDYDGCEARLVTLSKDYKFRHARKGSGRMFSARVARADVHASRETLVADLDTFRRDADADLAARLHTELGECVAEYERLKARAGALDFVDLLLKARLLVRDNDAVRQQFQRKFDCIFVDEFQDTDPLQAEILLLLASDDPRERDWRKIRPVPGKLFIVGDPKQSIYRFRRADVGVYFHVCDLLEKGGARRLYLQTSFRASPEIQHVVNAAFAPVMTGDRTALQASYVPLAPYREAQTSQPAVVVLPVPKPYGPYRLSGKAIESSLPDAVGALVHWLIEKSGWMVTERKEIGPGTDRVATARDEPVPTPIQARHICLLFRRFMHFRDDVTQPYVQALEARGIPHLLVGGRTFHGREEVESIRAALSAIEWPDDELNVFATLRGPLFAIGDEELLEYRHQFGPLHPFRIRPETPDHLRAIVEALMLLRGLHGRRNYRPVADTITRLLDATRAHVAFVLRPAGEQTLANVLHIAELARQYEASGGISFRGFVDELRDSADEGQAGEAPILEEGSDGVRLMTVHKAKGLEFPVVILADITAKLCQAEAGRYIDVDRQLCVQKIAGCSPIDLLEHDAEELERDRAEGVRVAYVAATRARDLLIVPAVGDQPWEGGWVSPLNDAIYPPLPARRDAGAAAGCPPFRKDSVLTRANGDPAGPETVCPGLHLIRAPGSGLRDPGSGFRAPGAGLGTPGSGLRDPGSGLGTPGSGLGAPGSEFRDPEDAEEHRVVWWDPFALDLNAEAPFGLRHPELIAKTVQPDVLQERRRQYEQWRYNRQDAILRGSTPSLRVRTTTEWVRGGAGTDPLAEQPGLWDSADRASVVEIIGGEQIDASRPYGPSFGTLVHAVLATSALDASPDAVRALAVVQGRILGAPTEEIEAAAIAASNVLAQPLMARARAAQVRGRCRRESPVTYVTPAGTLIEGTVDLAFDESAGTVVVDFKTDRQIAHDRDRYVEQLRFYAAALARVTGRPTSAVLMRV